MCIRDSNTVVSLIGGIASTLISTVFAAFILLNKEKLGRQAERICFAYLDPEHAVTFVALCTMSYNAFSRFIKGQFLDAVILGCLCFVGMSVLGFPYAIMISAVVGITAVIPIFGAYVGAIVGAIVTLTVSPLQALWFLVFLLILQQLESNLIYPKVVGHSVGLPGMWVFTAVLLGGNIMGVKGMLIAVPIFSVLYCILRESVETRLKKRKLDL